MSFRRIDDNQIIKKIINPITRTTICEIQGDRESQEDAYSCSIINGFELLSLSKQKSVLAKLNHELTNDIAKIDLAEIQGATFLATIIHKNIVQGYSVGDSRSYILIWDKNGTIKKCKRLNKHLHNPQNPAEAKRIWKIGQSLIIGGKLTGFGYIVSVTRALGDTALERNGLIHEGDHLKATKIIIPKGGRAIVLTTCDGAFEQWEQLPETNAARALMNEQKSLQQWLQKFLKMHGTDVSVEQLGHGLVTVAYETGSTDNITVMATEINPKDTTTIVNIIADGHNGRMIADEICNLAPGLLQKMVNEELAKKNKL